MLRVVQNYCYTPTLIFFRIRSLPANCENDGPELKCSNVSKDEPINAKISFEIDQTFCKENEPKMMEFHLAEFPNDTLIVNLKCETCKDYCPGYIINSNDCNKHGDLVCGGCDCQ